MGCDIHAHIEFKENEDRQWYHFASPWIIRDYELFAYMANVRGNGGLFEPRGVPKDASFTTVNQYTLRIGDKDSDYECTPELAKSFLKEGSEVWDDKRITQPDWHTPSWLGHADMQQIHKLKTHRNVTFNAIVMAMEGLALYGAQVRIIFWFDN